MSPKAGQLFVVDEGQGPPVLLLHGQPGSHKDMDGIVEGLRGSARVITLDRFGYGQSPLPAQSIDAQADAYVELLESLSATPAVVVGHSFSGGIALTMASRHPESVAGLVLVGSIGGADSVTVLDRYSNIN